MKRLIAILLLTLTAGSAMAQHRGHHGHHGHHGHGNHWIAPAIVGGVIGYGISRNYYEPYYAPPPVVYYTPPAGSWPRPPAYYVYSAPVTESGCVRYIIQTEQGQFIREETRCN